jgi:2'-5' RNA ligase|tara:strand:- start:2839 stop:3420 length:582 start_codon:yes stop_codon:yes gene_type:complete
MPKKLKIVPLRCFVGVKFPLLQQIKPLLDDLSDLAKDESLKIRMTPPANLHLTLKFIGTVAEGQEIPIQSVLTQVGHQLKSFNLSCSGVGFFKNSMWVGAQETEQLQELVVDLNRGLAVLDFEVESKPYSPHITIARFAGSAKEKLKTLESKYEKAQWGQMEVNKFHLYRSDTLPEGPKYFILSKYGLGEPNL